MLSWVALSIQEQLNALTARYVPMTLSDMIDDFISDLKRNADGKYPWREPVENALRETNAVRKPARIAHAETAIYARRQALASVEEANEERAALNDAIEQLQNDRARKCDASFPV
jgi:hypothetical protein